MKLSIEKYKIFDIMELFDFKSKIVYLRRMSLNEQIRCKMKKFRELKGMLQRDFSEKTGIPLYQISRMERGASEWTLSRIEQVCSAFNLPPHFFLGSEDHNNPRYELTHVIYALDDKKFQTLQNLLLLISQTDQARLNTLVLAIQSLATPSI